MLPKRCHFSLLRWAKQSCTVGAEPVVGRLCTKVGGGRGERTHKSFPLTHPPSPPPPTPRPKPLLPTSVGVAESVARRITTDCSCSGGGEKQTWLSFPMESKHNIDCDEAASFSACNLPSGFPLFLMYIASLSPSCWRFLPKCLLASSLAAQREGR